jgi:glycosyltransferase involved in cell wall biosynthesis
MLVFTVAIPTYNGEKRLHKVLECLHSCCIDPSLEQLHIPNFCCEVIVVDNNSSDQTAKIVQEYQANWPSNSELRYFFEPEQGAAFARQKAVEEAQGELVGFLDDDNLPATDWIAAAIAFGQAHPKAGAYSSQVHGQFEVEPPQNFQKIACFLALAERGNQPHRYEPKQKILPAAAGLVVRRQAWLQSVPKRLVLNFKGREAGLASEDLEAVFHIQQAGWEIWYNPDMHVLHDIPGWRLETDYLVSLVRCIGLSRHHIRMMRLKPWQKLPVFFAYLLKDVCYLLLHILKYQDSKDAIAACERELLRSILMSPFFLWKKKLFDSPQLLSWNWGKNPKLYSAKNL